MSEPYELQAQDLLEHCGHTLTVNMTDDYVALVCDCGASIATFDKAEYLVCVRGEYTATKRVMAFSAEDAGEDFEGEYTPDGYDDFDIDTVCVEDVQETY